jgi:hypothetical protein
LMDLGVSVPSPRARTRRHWDASSRSNFATVGAAAISPDGTEIVEGRADA